MKYSLAILKPDCLQRNLSEKVLKILKDNGFRIILKKRLRLSKKDIERVYRKYIPEKWFTPFVEFMISSDSLVLIVEHDEDDAIERLNELVGPTDPQESGLSRIRGLGENIRRNLIHSTKNEKTFRHEFLCFFDKKELKALVQ